MMAAFVAYEGAQSLAPSTIRNRDSLLASISRSIQSSLVEATLLQLRTHLGREGVTASTKRTEKNVLTAFYRFAFEDGYRADDPSLKLPKIQVPKGEPRPFTREQIDAMLNSGAYVRTRMMILLGYYQGFRVSQIARVRGDDIDFASGTIRTVAKGNKERRLPLHPAVREIAMTMPAGWWFPARNGADKPIGGASVTDLITKAKKRAGITDPKLTPHSLRHAFASELSEANVDVLVLQKLMLHESLSTTQVYAGVSHRRRQEGIESLPALVKPVHSGRTTALAKESTA